MSKAHSGLIPSHEMLIYLATRDEGDANGGATNGSSRPRKLFTKGPRTKEVYRGPTSLSTPILGIIRQGQRERPPSGASPRSGRWLRRWAGSHDLRSSSGSVEPI